ncbi:MAG: cation:proton antiporter [Methanobacteriaceae archaeon]|nr:cation:proton antiporter [Methanobacteriaceae archaeon]MDP2835416.1 cation:proton antiporter [Methanobacteriaceae archaeon]MDP3033609.1 cation:proton antiporter [Methanobacteriaceae archaeon]MDP3486227.1 cation:proton antiporter [Methanobacteriaceae archaeon]MDP3624138.1 cation:proton antiporter [Methanobacteriaceae archaeon]
MELIILKDIVIIFALSVIVLLLFHKIKIPTILGFFLTGIVAGPHGLSLISEVQQVEILAEIGIIFLLFTIALEFSLEKFSQIKRQALIGGSLQLLFTFVIVFLISWSLGLGVNTSIFTGFLISFSSTAIVLRLLQDRNEIDTPHGRTSLGILIFQDVAVVPIILLTPIIAGNSISSPSLLILLLECAGILIFTIISAKWLVPSLLYHVARLKNRELFLLTTILICFGITWLTTLVGLSPALGAFLAGLIISNTKYAHQALGNVISFHDIFMSFFFVSIGMLLNINFFFQNIALILLLTLGVLVIKSVTAGLATRFLGFPLRIMVIVGLILSQVGEFSFILSKVGIQYGLINLTIFQLFLSVSLLTMTLTPFLMAMSPKTSELLHKIPLINQLDPQVVPLKTEFKLEDHLIIIGYGINGKNVSMAALNSSIPYVVIEINPEMVKDKEEEHFVYGDATQEYVLKKAEIQKARIMVIAISDPLNTRKITELSKRINPELYIIIRTRYIDEIKILKSLGADEVIPEEFETSVEIFSRVLDEYQVPHDEINQFITRLREENYGLFQRVIPDKKVDCDIQDHIPPTEVIMIKISAKSSLAEKTLKSDIEKKFGVKILSIIRNQEIINYPTENQVLKNGDILTVSGLPEKISKLQNHLENL